MNELLTPEEVQAFVRGDISEEKRLDIAARLGRIGRQDAKALSLEGDGARERPRGRRTRRRRLLARLEAEGVTRVADTGPPLRGLAAYEALLERCQAVRFHDPEEMVKLAAWAVLVAKSLSVKRYGSRQVIDCRCRAMIELGNANRVADRLWDAEEAMAEAGRLFLLGTRDELLEARLFDVQASLYADSRRFDSAREALDVVQAIHRRRGDRHLIGRALISKGLYASYDEQPEEAIVFLTEGLTLVDRKREPSLMFIAVHNLAHALMVYGRYRDARTMLFPIRGSEDEAGGRVNLLKVRWLEAQISAGLGDLERAERDFEFVRSGFLEEDLPYKSALAGLELAEVYLRQGRSEESRSLGLETIEVFQGLHIPREGLVSVLVLQRSLEMRLEKTGALLRTVIDFLKKAENDSSLRFLDVLGPDHPLRPA